MAEHSPHGTSHSRHHGNVLRARDGREARVTNVEIFFDLVYAFAVTQLSHHLLEHLTLLGAVQTLTLLFGVWLIWQYTCWVSNWFDPETKPVRFLLLAIMAIGLVLSAAIPEAFAERGMVVAVCFVVIQVGRTLFVLYYLGRNNPLTPNFQRILGWVCISGALWLAGGLSEGRQRLIFWAVGVLADYVSPMIGFWLPVLGRSTTQEWTIEGGHLAERCQAFVMMALGESIVEIGAGLSDIKTWTSPILIAYAVTFIGSVAIWWVYFDTSSKDGREAIVHSPDPGRIGAYFHYVHVIMVAGVIVSAVAYTLMITHPAQRVSNATMAVLIAGPGLYLLGNALYKKVIYGRFPLSHITGLVLLAAMAPISLLTDILMAGGLTTVLIVGVVFFECLGKRFCKVKVA